MCLRCGAQVLPARQPDAMTLLLDSNVYDAIYDADAVALVAALCVAGKIELLMTHVQHEELLGIPDAEKRVAIATIPFVIAPTYGFIFGVSKMGLARFGEPAKIDAIEKRVRRRHTNDALIAVTAEYESATLVTDDARLSNFAARAGIVVWASERFLQVVAELATT